MAIEIETPRFVLCELSGRDVSERYLNWLRDPEASANISAADDTRTLDDLRRYVAERTSREDVLFLGIFDKSTGIHIGNVKYEPVDSVRGYAVMGILIGDISYRGRGVAQEVLFQSGRWLKEHRGVREILLGVRRDNHAAIGAYKRVGYRQGTSPHLPIVSSEALTMVWLV